MYSLGCGLIRVSWVIHWWLFKDINFKWSGALTMVDMDC